jgi:DEAD/DEAH box helicase domain-containing protein
VRGFKKVKFRVIEEGISQTSGGQLNALELGIDIGHLGCAILSGYPGTVASTWQQAGRAGRRQGNSVVILVAGGSPLDQFIIKNPQYFFEQTPEYGLINPDNPYILSEHVKCAAYELPFKGDQENPPTFMGKDVGAILEHLEERAIVYHSAGRWNWSSQSFPAADISLRSASADNFVVVDTTNENEVIGEVDWASAPMLIHDEAIYIHGGEQYHVLHLDYQAKKAYVKKVNVDYYTDANLAVNVKVINVDKETESYFSPRFGEVSVTAVATIFKKIKLYTYENVGSGQIDIPEMNLHTQGMWFTLPNSVVKSMDPRTVGAVLSGLANLILNIASLFVMSDKSDLGVAVEVRSSHDDRPTVYVYDSYPGGVGLAEKVYFLLPELLKACLSLLESCDCSNGCPGCVGPTKDETIDVKSLVIQALRLSGDEKDLTGRA